MAGPIIRVNDTQLQNFVHRSPEVQEQILQEWKQEGSLELMEQVRIATPVRTGIMRESVDRRFTPRGFTVFLHAAYAKFVEKGTGPHMIFPRTVHVLHWVDSTGVSHFARKVNHPGFPGRFFIKRTADMMRPVLAQLYRFIWERLH